LGDSSLPLKWYEDSKKKFPNHIFIDGTIGIKSVKDFENLIEKSKEEKYSKVILILEVDKLPTEVIFLLKRFFTPKEGTPLECIILYGKKFATPTKVNLNDTISFYINLANSSGIDSCPICLEELKEESKPTLCRRCKKMW
jgi:hypothetical protein